MHSSDFSAGKALFHKDYKTLNICLNPLLTGLESNHLLGWKDYDPSVNDSLHQVHGVLSDSADVKKSKAHKSQIC